MPPATTVPNTAEGRRSEAAPRTGESAQRDAGVRPLRPDIQGLRAIAVVSVLLWHARLPLITGGFVGVDVFFVISGFLMTRLLVKELVSTGRISLAGFYARRARRLLPAAMTCLAGTVLLTYLFIPAARWRSIGWDIVSSALYGVNWRMAHQSVDYLAEGSAASPVQHYWSLAVEEQYYAFWPIALLLVGFLTLRTGLVPHLGKVLVSTLVLLGVASYAWSIAYTAAQPGRAYFVTTTRLWELSLGGLVVLLGPRLASWGPGVAKSAVAAGLGCIALSLVQLDSGSAFPGSIALLPCLGTALVIAFGPSCTGPANPVALLSWKPFQWLGKISYSLYLWHWPLLVAATAYAGSGQLGATVGAGIVLLSVVPAWLSFVLVEEPVRRRRLPQGKRAHVGALRLAVICTVASVTVGGVLIADVALQARSTEHLRDQALGARSLPGEPLSSYRPVDSPAFLVPTPALASEDLFHPYYDRKCGRQPEPVTQACVFGDVTGSVRVAVVGDSHAVMWLPALSAVAEKRHWRLEVMARPSCPLVDAPVLWHGKRNTSCESWNSKVLAELKASPRDLVIATQVNVYQLAGDDGPLRSSEARAVFAAGLARTWGRLEHAGNRVAVLMDGPRFRQNVAECVSQHPSRLSACAAPKAEALTATNAAQVEALARAKGVLSIDLTPYLCPGDVCPVAIGNTIMYIDNNHVSATYMRSLTPRLDAALRELPS